MPARKPDTDFQEMARERMREIQSSTPKVQPKFVDEKHAHQAAFIRDPSKMKVALTSRRSGKSWGDIAYLYWQAWLHPNTPFLYIGLTHDSIEQTVWEECFKPLNDLLKLGCRFKTQPLTVTLPNESRIYAVGMNSSSKDKDTALGGKRRIIIVDEAQSISGLEDLVFSKLKPMVADYQGTICLTGTPGDMAQGYFFDLTHDQNPGIAGKWEAQGWSGHRWCTFDNPHMKDKWAQEIADLKRAKPRVEETPAFQRNYLGIWTADDNRKVYRYDPKRNDGVMPQGLSPKGWHYVLGIDLGWEDPTAFVVCAYHENLPVVFAVECEKESKLTFDQVETRIRGYEKRYDFDKLIIDGANKQAVESMRDRGISLTAAEKSGKSDFIEVINGDFIRGAIMIDPDRCRELTAEYNSLVWDEKALEKGRREEHPGCANHICLVGETLVTTQRGQVPIKDVVVGDMALTRMGFRRVLASMQTGVRPTVRVTLADGRTLEGTADHPIWTEQGWVALEALIGYKVASVMEATWDAEKWWSGSAIDGSDIQTPSIRPTATTGSAATPEKMSLSPMDTCTDMFGSDRTDRSDMGCTYTTQTRIQTTTRYQTSVASPRANTSLGTCRNQNGRRTEEGSLNLRSKPQGHGTGLLRAGSGIDNRQSKTPSSPRSTDANASSADKISNPKERPLPCAVRPATQKGGTPLALTTSRADVSSAVRSSERTNISKPHLVLVPVVQLACTGSEEPVFNLTVDVEHEFFANGILSANCDSMLYSFRECYHYISQQPVKPKTPGSQEWYAEEERRMLEAETETVERSIEEEKERKMFEGDDPWSDR